MIRKKIIADIKNQLKQRTTVEQGVILLWELVNDRPFNMSEYEAGLKGNPESINQLKQQDDDQ